ncbi:hypothetical protein O181_046226 [Austropuccinia psidii MF-1]|uniref:Uncharacterized protein n=1 Tax=Austropuccinia psidii MF-1 TaxID=1389203 RepID=A0A9Q3DTS3_9BASI|nr:hypothetical protein [Austropuccinia psidii MF-1]
MWKRACEKEDKFIAEEKEYKRKRYEKTHKEPDFREGDQVVIFNLNFKNIKGQNKRKDLFVGPFTIFRLIGKDSVEFRLTEEFSRKDQVFPVSLVNPYHQTGEDMFPSRNKSHTPQDIVEVEDCSGPVKKISLHGKYHKQ